MIIIEGPDATGKTTLARSLNLPYFHYTKDSTYVDYLNPLATLDAFDGVLDRFMFSEYPYSKIMARTPQYPPKQWHNVTLLALAMNPIVILCIHKPRPELYAKEQYLPLRKWDICLELYRRFLAANNIYHIEYDYSENLKPSVFEMIESKFRHKADWWAPMWKEGVGMIGSHTPKLLIVAQEMGPNNMNNLPFETGPTGHMMTELLDSVKMPLGDIAITNMVKAPRGIKREVDKRDLELFEVELANLKPKKVLFMGTVSKAGIKIAKSLGIECCEMNHLGWFHRTGRKDYCNVFKTVIGGAKSVWDE